MLEVTHDFERDGVQVLLRGFWNGASPNLHTPEVSIIYTDESGGSGVPPAPPSWLAHWAAETEGELELGSGGNDDDKERLRKRQNWHLYACRPFHALGILFLGGHGASCCGSMGRFKENWARANEKRAKTDLP